MSSVQYIGLDELVNDFRTFPIGAARAFQTAGTNYAKVVYNQANKTVPVKTGALKRSIGYAINQKELRLYANEHYAGFINFGTTWMKARPFITKPQEDNLDKFVNDFADQLLNHFRK